MLAGCAPSGGGGVDTGSFSGTEKDVASALDDLADAARAGDGQRACSELLSRKRVDALGTNCRKAMDDQFDNADTFTLDVEDITVSGNTARARVVSDFDGKDATRTLVLVRESNRWRLDAIER